MNESGGLKPIDRWVLSAGVIIAVALITASAIRPESTSAYLSALGGLGGLLVVYFMFGR
jgi:hypothetical protein